MLGGVEQRRDLVPLSPTLRDAPSLTGQPFSVLARAVRSPHAHDPRAQGRVMAYIQERQTSGAVERINNRLSTIPGVRRAFTVPRG